MVVLALVGGVALTSCQYFSSTQTAAQPAGSCPTPPVVESETMNPKEGSVALPGSIPPIDAAVTDKTKTATFAYG